MPALSGWQCNKLYLGAILIGNSQLGTLRWCHCHTRATLSVLFKEVLGALQRRCGVALPLLLCFNLVYLAGKHWTPAKVHSRTFDFLHQYKEKYIDTGSIKPLTDTMIGLFFFSYAVAWPQVRSLSTILSQVALGCSLPHLFPCTLGHLSQQGKVLVGGYLVH